MDNPEATEGSVLLSVLAFGVSVGVVLVRGSVGVGASVAGPVVDTTSLVIGSGVFTVPLGEARLPNPILTLSKSKLA